MKVICKKSFKKEFDDFILEVKKGDILPSENLGKGEKSITVSNEGKELKIKISNVKFWKNHFEHYKEKTLIINLIGAPGTGKSTLAAEIFARLKWKDCDAELVTEFAKELVWEKRFETFKDEIYLFAKQNHRLFRVNGKVDYAITDRPIFLSIYYNNKFGEKSENLNNLIMEQHDKYENLNILLKRKKKFNPNGRNQREEEANQMAIEIKDLTIKLGIDFVEMDASPENVDKIIELIEEKRRQM